MKKFPLTDSQKYMTHFNLGLLGNFYYNLLNNKEYPQMQEWLGRERRIWDEGDYETLLVLAGLVPVLFDSYYIPQKDYLEENLLPEIQKLFPDFQVPYFLSEYDKLLEGTYKFKESYTVEDFTLNQIYLNKESKGVLDYRTKTIIENSQDWGMEPAIVVRSRLLNELEQRYNKWNEEDNHE